MATIVLVGCGVVGAAIAYELSLNDHQVIVLEQALPGEGATGAALGIAMGVISQKAKGHNWRLREASLRRYRTLLPELAALGHEVPHNQQGILSLCFDATALPRWRSLQAIRQRQGWLLEIWSPEQIAIACPHLQVSEVVAGIYSPQDLQIAPKAFTQALVAAAQQRGVTVHLGTPVTGFSHQHDYVTAVQTPQGEYAADWVILTAGLGSTALTRDLECPLPLMPVLGQGLRVRLPEPMGQPGFQPVINGEDVHLVPLGQGEYGVAATVEFPDPAQSLPTPQPAALAAIWEGALRYCPALAQADILETWHGLRPRPQGQAAPVIQPLAGWRNVILATGHYRNGVLLAPATAQQVTSLLSELES